MRDPWARRNASGTLSLPPGHEGPITRLFGVNGHLEIYTAKATFKAQTPDGVDPGRTNPAALWVIAQSDDVGSAHPAVARTFITAAEVLKHDLAAEGTDKERVLSQMHLIKQQLVALSKRGAELRTAITTEVEKTHGADFKLAPGGNALENFPRVLDLDEGVTGVLVHAKRVLREVCVLLDLYFHFDRKHSRFDHALEAVVAKLGEENSLSRWLRHRAKGAAKIGALRDGQEHSTTTVGAALHIENFKLLPSNEIQAPSWYLTGAAPDDIRAHSEHIEEFLIELAEGAFVGAVDQTLPDRFPKMCFDEIEKPDPEAPVRYALVVDMSQFPPGTFNTQAG